MSKTEIYSWRLPPDLKQRLEHAAREERTSMGGLLEQIAREWLGSTRPNETDEARQLRLHAQAEKVIGTVALGEGPYTRELIRARVRANANRKRNNRRASPRTD